MFEYQSEFMFGTRTTKKKLEFVVIIYEIV